MSHGWIILLTLVAQINAAPLASMDEPRTIYTSPQLQPLPPNLPPVEAAGAGVDVRLTSASEAEAPLEGQAIGNGKPLPLAPRGSSPRETQLDDRAPPSPGGSITTVIGSLAIVLGLLFGVTWVMRRAAPAGSQLLPTDVVQVLGRAMLSPRQQMQLVRLGDKLVLVANTPAGVHTLTEITDRAEVERLAAACEAARGGSATGTFRQVLSQLETAPTPAGFFGRDEVAQATQTRSRQQRRGGTEVRHA